jgi:hypothetical protein
VQAYRRFTGKQALGRALEECCAPGATFAGPEEWFALRDSVVGAKPKDPARPRGAAGQRLLPEYRWFENCNGAAFAHAANTLRARMQQWGPASDATIDWTLAQSAVFENCAGRTLVLPAAAPAAADALLRADRVYQTAAAYFYGMHYDEAARRFRAIAADTSSPWRGWGRYLAARAEIRHASFPDDKDDGSKHYAAAEADLQAVLADAGVERLHASARGLMDFIAFRARPLDRLHELSRAIATATGVSSQAFLDYQRLLDKFVGDTVDFQYDAIQAVDSIRSGDDMTDWILAMQGGGGAAEARALSQRKTVRSLPWLVAALWRIPPAHDDAPAVLAEAATLDRASPAFETVLFLRVRLLAARGARAEARALLASIPAGQSAGADAETRNLFQAERFMLATSLEELLAASVRTIVAEADESPMYGALRRARSARQARGSPTFDEDAAAVFNSRLPLDRLVAASASTVLPGRLRTRVAVTAFTRAWLLDRSESALAVVPHLRTLAPAAAADLERYANAATDDERHRAGLLLLLRTPGMRPYVRGIDDEVSYQAAEPLRTFDHTFSRNWWCGIERADSDGINAVVTGSVPRDLLYATGEVPFPEFLTAQERSSVARELEALTRKGPAPQYLTNEALTWARARPNDPDAAEALALAVEGWRWTCPGSSRDPRPARLAFETLHRLFPGSTWAKRTRYWHP